MNSISVQNAVRKMCIQVCTRSSLSVYCYLAGKNTLHVYTWVTASHIGLRHYQSINNRGSRLLGHATKTIRFEALTAGLNNIRIDYKSASAYSLLLGPVDISFIAFGYRSFPVHLHWWGRHVGKRCHVDARLFVADKSMRCRKAWVLPWTRLGVTCYKRSMLAHHIPPHLIRKYLPKADCSKSGVGCPRVQGYNHRHIGRRTRHKHIEKPLSY